MATARYTIDGEIPPTQVQIETRVDGGWWQPEVGMSKRAPGQYFHVPVEDEPGTLFRVRHTFEENPTEDDFSDWSTPGVLVVPEPGTALQFGALAVALALLQRRNRACRPKAHQRSRAYPHPSPIPYWRTLLG